MTDPLHLVPTKLLAPKIAAVAWRPRLARQVSQIGRCPLSLITASAGYGKTTLAAQALQASGRALVWYRLDEGDRDFSTFCHYLAAGIRKVFPRFKSAPPQVFELTVSAQKPAEELIAQLLAELEKVLQNDLVIVLDDYHLIQDSPDIRRGIQYLINYMLPRMHMVLISRVEVELRLSRLKAMRKVVEVSEADLQFTAEEIQDLYDQVFDVVMSDSQARVLYRQTDGWISGLILFHHGLKDKDLKRLDAHISHFNGVQQSIFRYFEENVFDPLTPAQKEFLTKTSLLDRLELGICNRLLKSKHAARILDELASRHLFTFALDDDAQSFYYHHLFQEFLQTRLRSQVSEEAWRDLHRNIGRIYEADGSDEKALDHYLKAAATEDCVRLISRIARYLIKAGRLEQIKAYLKGLTDLGKASDPWVQYLAAGANELVGLKAQAVAGYERALVEFRRCNSEQGVQFSLLDLAMHHLYSGEHERCEAIYNDLLAQHSMPPFYRILIYGYLADLSPHLGRIEEGQSYLRRGRSLIPTLEASQDRRMAQAWLELKQGTLQYCIGEYASILNRFQRAQGVFGEYGQQRLVIACYLWQVLALGKLGRYRQGREISQKGLALIAKIGLRDSLHPWMLTCSGHCAMVLGDTRQGLDAINEGLNRFMDLGDRKGQATVYIKLARFNVHAHRWDTAQEYVSKGIAVIDDLELTIFKAELQALQGVIHAGRGDLHRALEMLQQAQSLVSHIPWDQAWIESQVALAYWLHHKRQQAVNHMQACIDLCRRKKFDTLFIEEKSWVIPLLVATAAESRDATYIEGLIARIGTDAMEPLAALVTEGQPVLRTTAAHILRKVRHVRAPGLRIYLLGKFAAFMGNHKINDCKWKNKKAQTLFEYLAYSASRGYQKKDVLMELLWPEEDARKTAKRLHVTLASLRKILEPDIVKGTPSAYLKSNGDAYRLHTGKEGWIDIEAFSRELQLAQQAGDTDKAVAHYRKAESLYQGDFLEEERYAQWCQEPKERFREDYLHVLMKLIQHYEQQRDDQHCILFAGKYLIKDKYAEHIYRRLMRCHARMGNKTMVVKTFKKCESAIVEEFNCPLSSQSIQLYHRLVSA